MRIFGRRKAPPEPGPVSPAVLPYDGLDDEALLARLVAEDDEPVTESEEDLDPGDPDALVDHSEVLRDAGRYDEARQWLQRAADVGHPTALADLGDLLPDGSPRKTALLRELAADETQPHLRALALHHVEQGAHADAVPVWRALVERGDWRAVLHLAKAQEALGRAEQAMESYRVAMREPRTRHEAAPEYGRLLLADTPDPEVDEGLALLGRSRHFGAPYLDRYRAGEAAPPPQPAPAEPISRLAEWGGELLLAWRHEQRGNDEIAERLYRGLALSDHDQVDAAAGLARMLQHRGETSEARRWRESAEGWAPLDGPTS